MPKFVMSDARVFTDYNPNCELNNIIQKNYNVTNSNEYRNFLQNNAEQLIKDFSKNASLPECSLCPVCKKAIE